MHVKKSCQRNGVGVAAAAAGGGCDPCWLLRAVDIHSLSSSTQARIMLQSQTNPTEADETI